MIIYYDPDVHVAETTHYTCSFHQANPDIASFAGCTCSGSYSTRPATPEEYAANRARRLDRERREREWFEQGNELPADFMEAVNDYRKGLK